MWSWLKGTALANVCEDTLGPVVRRARRGAARLRRGVRADSVPPERGSHGPDQDASRVARLFLPATLPWPGAGRGDHLPVHRPRRPRDSPFHRGREGRRPRAPRNPLVEPATRDGWRSASVRSPASRRSISPVPPRLTVCPRAWIISTIYRRCTKVPQYWGSFASSRRSERGGRSRSLAMRRLFPARVQRSPCRCARRRRRLECEESGSERLQPRSSILGVQLRTRTRPASTARTAGTWEHEVFLHGHRLMRRVADAERDSGRPAGARVSSVYKGILDLATCPRAGACGALRVEEHARGAREDGRKLRIYRKE